MDADVFNKFKAQDGGFSKDISNDPKGLLSLYNAAHLHVHGEPTLEEAITFARRHLRSMRGSDLKTPLANQVKRALHIPLPRACKRIETLHYISEYKEEEGYNPVLLELAKLDFNLLQHVHLKEHKAITRYVIYLSYINRIYNPVMIHGWLPSHTTSSNKQKTKSLVNTTFLVLNIIEIKSLRGCLF